jgi:hypothetical protein
MPRQRLARRRAPDQAATRNGAGGGEFVPVAPTAAPRGRRIRFCFRLTQEGRQNLLLEHTTFDRNYFEWNSKWMSP